MSEFYRLSSLATGELFELRGRRFPVGRDRVCDVQVNVPSASRCHVSLEIESGVLYAEDLGSSNGTFVNGQRCRSRRPLRSRDLLGVGEVEFTVLAPGDADNLTVIRPISVQPQPSYVTSEGEGNATQLVNRYPLPSDWPADSVNLGSGLVAKETAREFERSVISNRLSNSSTVAALWHCSAAGPDECLIPLQPSALNEWIVGRGTECDVVLSDHSVSASHAKLKLRGATWTLIDNGSTNGTSINGKTLESETRIETGDLLAIGSVNLLFRSLVRA